MSAWTAAEIGHALVHQTFQRRFLVVVPECYWTGYECDLLGVADNLKIIDIEIKVSRSDLKADVDKDKWWHRLGSSYNAATRKYITPPPAPREWPPRVWKHYYAAPREVFEADGMLDLLPSNSGVVALRRGHTGAIVAESLRRARPNPDAKPITAQQAVDIARLASLRMWRAIGERRAA
jgi:hypothetical protein